MHSHSTLNRYSILINPKFTINLDSRYNKTLKKERDFAFKRKENETPWNHADTSIIEYGANNGLERAQRAHFLRACRKMHLDHGASWRRGEKWPKHFTDFHGLHSARMSLRSTDSRIFSHLFPSVFSLSLSLSFRPFKTRAPIHTYTRKREVMCHTDEKRS